MFVSDRQAREAPARQERKKLRAWQKALAALSIVIALVGAGWMGYVASTGDAPAATSGDGAGALASGFAPTTPEGDEGTADDGSQTDRLIDSASGAVFRLGFGFFAGFAVGYAMRMFVRVTLVGAGVAILGLAGLQYAGVIQVDWERLSGGFDTFGTWFSAQTQGFVAFVQGYLPTFGAGLAGAFVGFRRP
ncbi:MAG: hypothetical protein D6695_07310 [Planctomycetota bacterium]|nr:MAG: hypothetical protein D6695_07310 [Planctomycetota bacterium]